MSNPENKKNTPYLPWDSEQDEKNISYFRDGLWYQQKLLAEMEKDFPFTPEEIHNNFKALEEIQYTMKEHAIAVFARKKNQISEDDVEALGAWWRKKKNDQKGRSPKAQTERDKTLEKFDLWRKQKGKPRFFDL